MIIRPISFQDVDQAALLEQKAGDVHWSRAQFMRELGFDLSRLFVVASAEEVVGYGGYWKVGDEAQITNLVIQPERRRQGLGRGLLNHLLEHAVSEYCRKSTLEVRAGNTAAQALYKRTGFIIQGRRVKMYENPVEDAVLMEKKL